MIVFTLSAESFHLRLAIRTQAPAMVMVWVAITADGRSPLIFIDRGVKTNAEYYRENMLEDALKPWASKHFGHIGHSNRTQQHRTQHAPTKNG